MICWELWMSPFEFSCSLWQVARYLGNRVTELLDPIPWCARVVPTLHAASEACTPVSLASQHLHILTLHFQFVRSPKCELYDFLAAWHLVGLCRTIVFGHTILQQNKILLLNLLMCPGAENTPEENPAARGFWVERARPFCNFLFGERFSNKCANAARPLFQTIPRHFRNRPFAFQINRVHWVICTAASVFFDEQIFVSILKNWSQENFTKQSWVTFLLK